jgi:hypothetical protein
VTPASWSDQVNRTSGTRVSRVAHRGHSQLPCGQVLLHRRMTVQMRNSSEISGPMYWLAAAGRRQTVKARLPRKPDDRMTP